MAEKGINIFVGATSIRTCLGNKSETLTAMQNGESGLMYCEEFSMYAGISQVNMIDGYTRFESMVIEQITEILGKSKFHYLIVIRNSLFQQQKVILICLLMIVTT